MKLLKKVKRFLMLGFLPFFGLTTAVSTNMVFCSVPNEEEMESSRHWKVLSHNISAEIDLKAHLLKATDLMTLQTGTGEFKAFLNESLKIHYVRLAGWNRSISSSQTPQKDLEFSFSNEYDLSRYFPGFTDDIRKKYDNASVLSVSIPASIRKERKEMQILISYEGKIYDPPKRAEFSRQNITDQTAGLIGEEGVYLSEATHWYPEQPKSLCTFQLEVTLPSEYEVVSEGDFSGRDIDESSARISWDIPYPTESLHLIAGKYIVTKSTYRDIEVSTYFFPEEQHLSESYIQAVKKYLRMYEEMIGAYPYKKFSVVENFFPTGYGMPSFTLLGRQVIRLPFIIHTSLGHEVLHNWWGNSVFVDYEKGNWCEGLTTYLADYHYKELKSPEAAEQYRREVCRDYTNYVVQAEEDFPLTVFQGRTTPATRAIGYGKTLMLFHMLRRHLGDEIFYKCLREFYKNKVWSLASWKDVREVFETNSDQDLAWFFGQWAERSGAPVLKLNKPILERKEGQYMVHLEVEQEEQPYRLDVPIEIEMEKETENKRLTCSFSEETQSSKTCPISSTLKTRPLSVSVDPDQHLFRKLTPEEIPAILSGVLGDKDQLVVMIPEENEPLNKAYEEMAVNLTRTGKAKRINLKEATDQDLREHSLFVLGNIMKLEELKKKGLKLPEDLHIKQETLIFNGNRYTGDASILFTMKNPWNEDKTMAFFYGRTAEAVNATAPKLLHYGKYSYLAFESGTNKDKGIYAVLSSPLIYRFD